MHSSPVGLGHLDNALFAIFHAWQFSLLLLRGVDDSVKVANADVYEEVFAFGGFAKGQVYIGCVVSGG